MMAVKKQNFFNTLFAIVKFGTFWLLVILQLPIIFLLPRGRISVWYMKVFMSFLLWLSGIKIIVHGKLSDHRPLMVVANHISIFEIATFPVA